MKQRTLGRSGPLVSEIGLGCNNFGGRIDSARSHEVVATALDCGITLFDVADVYGRDLHYGASEEILGAALGSRRRDIVLATKFGLPMDKQASLAGASRRYIASAAEASLRRLGTDWIDLYQLHTGDPQTPIEETLRALDDLIRAGKVRYVGCSNLPAWQVADAHHLARALGTSGFTSCQDELSLLSTDAERELIPAIEHFGMGLLPYFPLASGLLSGKHTQGEAPPPDTRMSAWKRWADRFLTARNWERVAALDELARAHGRTLIELAFGWLLAKPCVGSVIAGATRPEQVRTNVAAAATPLSPELLVALQALLDG